MNEIPLYRVDDGHTFSICLENKNDECYFINKEFEVEKTYYHQDRQEWFPGICSIRVANEYDYDLMDKKDRWDRVKTIIDDINSQFNSKLKEMFEKLIKHCGQKCEVVYAERREPEFAFVPERYKITCTIENTYWIAAIIRNHDGKNDTES